MKHAVAVLELDTEHNVQECDLKLGSRVIGGQPQIVQPKIALRRKGGGIVPTLSIYYDADETRSERRRFVIIKGGVDRAVAVEYDAALIFVCSIAMPGSGIVYAVFEAPIAAVDDEARCAVCQWPLAERIEDGCTRGNCSMRPRPENLYAPERAAREFEALIKGGTP